MNSQRPTWNQTFMEMAHVLAKRSTCLRLQTASIIVKDNVIVSVGYNGVASGHEHCNTYWKSIYEMCVDSPFYAQPLTSQERLCLRIREENVLLTLERYDDTELGYQSAVRYAQNQPRKSFDQFLHTDFFYREHHKWANENELHGEMNAILFAGRSGISLNGSEWP